MFAGLPSLSHEQQQKAVERIHELMAQGISSGQAIALVAEESCAQRIPASRSSRALKMRTSNYTAAIILISTLYCGFISVASTVQRTGA